MATAVFWLGMEAVFSVTFSGMIILDDHNYGAIGVVPDVLANRHRRSENRRQEVA